MTHIQHVFDFMKIALEQAQIALSHNEWPVGAVVVHDDQIIAKAHNQVEASQHPCAHAEILAANNARMHLQDKYLDKCTMFVTLEPCNMCMEYLKTLRLRTLVYGTKTQKFQQHNIQILDCIAEKECRDLLQQFGQRLRK